MYASDYVIFSSFLLNSLNLLLFFFCCWRKKCSFAKNLLKKKNTHVSLSFSPEQMGGFISIDVQYMLIFFPMWERYVDIDLANSLYMQNSRRKGFEWIRNWMAAFFFAARYPTKMALTKRRILLFCSIFSAAIVVYIPVEAFVTIEVLLIEWVYYLDSTYTHICMSIFVHCTTMCIHSPWQTGKHFHIRTHKIKSRDVWLFCWHPINM